MRRVSCAALAISLLPLALPAFGQTEPPSAVRTQLVAVRLDSVIGMPRYFRLYRAHLPPAQHVSYAGASVMLYDLAGTASLNVEGSATQSLGAGEGAFIATGQNVTLRTPASEPADLLLFLLTAGPNQRRPLLDLPAVIRELFRTPEPLPGLQEGPYEFSLVRLTMPASSGAGATPEYSRSGAALGYVLAGTAALTGDGKTETMGAETPFIERFGRVHRLANPGAAPLVLLEAMISPEGVPAVQPTPGR